MFDQLNDLYHRCGLDNLYSSVKFCREAFIGKNKVMTHGVARKKGRGIPEFVVQPEVKKNLQHTVRGTTKAAILEGDPDCPEMVAFSVYDQKPVNFVTSACTNLLWKEKSKKVWDSDAVMNVAMKFLRPEVTDQYNHGMNNVDQADQLRGSYRFDRWMRKRKWWWSIWMWGVQVLLTNAYVMYKYTHLRMWKTPPSRIMSQYDFRKAVALAWIASKDSSADPARSDQKRKHDSISNSTSSTWSSGKRAPVIKDHALDARSGALRDRLSDDVQHYLETSDVKQPCCQLCRHVEENPNIRNYKDVFRCDHCRVHLCISCNKLFHTISNVKKLKSEVSKNIKNK